MSPPRVIHPDQYIPPGGRQAADVADQVGVPYDEAAAALGATEVRHRTAGTTHVSGVCRGCGCTDERACAGGCAWVDDFRDVCTTCALRALAAKAGRAVGNAADAYLRQKLGPTVGGIVSRVAAGLLAPHVIPEQRKARIRAKAVIGVRAPRRTPRRGRKGGKGG